MSQTLSQSIANTLREAIQHGTYLCGDRLVELTLSQELDVSQNTIRDALHILEQEGWVQKIPRRGVYIPKYGVGEVKEIYTLWQTLESLALEWAIPTISDIEKQRLRETLIAIEQKIHHRDPFHAQLALQNFHTAIIVHANAPHTQMILSRIHNQTHLLEVQRLRLFPLSIDEWENRIEARFDVFHEIKDRNTSKAQKYIIEAIQYDAELVLPFLD